MRPRDLIERDPIETFYSPNMAPARDLAAGGILDLEAAPEPAVEAVLVKSNAALSASQGLASARGVYVTAAGPSSLPVQGKVLNADVNQSEPITKGSYS